MKMGRVSGKIALVTGAARGMGAIFAKVLIEQGAKVVLTDVLEVEGEATARALGENARFHRMDVTKELEWQEAIKFTEASFGPVSVLINNAGIAKFGPIESIEEKDYRAVIDVNQISVFLGMKTVFPSMKRAGIGSIVNISSTAGMVSAVGTLAYTASKFAVRGMTKCAALEFAARNIRVNSVHPGVIRTTLSVPEADNEALLAAISAQTPVGRIGEPEEVASVVLLLASDESLYTTGAEFIVDGGFTCA